MASVRDLRTKILSIKQIAKITKAMELVSTAKLKKLSQKIKTSRDYFSEVYQALHAIIAAIEEDSIFKVSSPDFKPQKPLWIIINSNFGLCGGYNLSIQNKVKSFLNKDCYIIAVGTKLQGFFKSQHLEVKQIFDFGKNKFDFNEARSIMAEVLALYNKGDIDAINIAYTKFINNVIFEPTILPLLPIRKITPPHQSTHQNVLVEFDPNPEVVLDNALPLYLNTVFYACVYESFLSEQASRRNAMQSANKNAEDMINDLSLKYNRARQSAITQEIIEIVSGAGADTD